jgi:AcrR family transcriptional regulator
VVTPEATVAQRADARTNRDRILTVADEVFGQGGPAASTEEVARRAGVGIATVFRHFPTKADLLTAVLVRRFERLRAEAEAARRAPDPGGAFFDLFTHLVTDAPTKIAIAEALLEAGGDRDGAAAEASLGLRRAVGAVLARAQRAGAVRDDVEPPEVYALLVATARAANVDAEVRARMLAIVFAGLAPVEVMAPLTQAPPTEAPPTEAPPTEAPLTTAAAPASP